MTVFFCCFDRQICHGFFFKFKNKNRLNLCQLFQFWTKNVNKIDLQDIEYEEYQNDDGSAIASSTDATVNYVRLVRQYFPETWIWIDFNRLVVL